MARVSHVALMMEAAGTYENSVKFCYTTQVNIPEDSHLYIHHYENRKSCIVVNICVALVDFDVNGDFFCSCL
jgi:hypothetical protein